MKEISSVNNYYIKSISKIIDQASTDFSLCIVEGKKVFETFLNSKLYVLQKVYLTEETKELENIIANKEKIIYVSKKIMVHLSKMDTPSQVIGVFKKKYNDDYKKIPIEGTYVLYNISNPGNLGTIIRTAVAFNRKYLILIEGCHYHNFKVVQATAGMLSKIKIYRVKWEEFMNLIRNKNIPIYALDMAGENFLNLKKEDLSLSYLLIGNEGNGIPDKIKEKSDRIISIQMSSYCESLNASIAASIIGFKGWGS